MSKINVSVTCVCIEQKELNQTVNFRANNNCEVPLDSDNVNDYTIGDISLTFGKASKNFDKFYPGGKYVLTIEEEPNTIEH